MLFLDRNVPFVRQLTDCTLLLSPAGTLPAGWNGVEIMYHGQDSFSKDTLFRTDRKSDSLRCSWLGLKSPVLPASFPEGSSSLPLWICLSVSGRANSFLAGTGGSVKDGVGEQRPKSRVCQLQDQPPWVENMALPSTNSVALSELLTSIPALSLSSPTVKRR